jgi:hypothetical protein
MRSSQGRSSSSSGCPADIFGDVGGRVEVVGVGERDLQPLRQRGADRGLTRTDTPITTIGTATSPLVCAGSQLLHQ